MQNRPNVYAGKRPPNAAAECRVWRNGRPFTCENSLKVVRHSPEGFDWGYYGSGPAQLALALLLDVLRNVRLAHQWYQDFKFAVVAGLGDQWVLTSDEIQAWYLRAVPSVPKSEGATHEAT